MPPGDQSTPTPTAPDLAKQMREAMRRMAASVAVVSSRRAGERYAMAASAVTSLSLDPPSLLVCINREASIYPVLAAGSRFCINVLSAAHEAVSAACSGARKGEARFAVGDWRDDSDTGTPYLGDAQASLICSMDAVHQYGTHGIVIGLVERVLLHGEVNPLIYLNGRYRSIRQTDPMLQSQ
ncbi:MAG TPA: flavin reductase family protein [Steroidobacter sp.]|uniref:flavin reductase family protein n=1 Tax=Steroidobacter sp. TaxID=1978227 RepID=UPI002ED8EB3D